MFSISFLDCANEAYVNIQRNRSLDLAVSSIISLDSPSPLMMPVSPGMDSNDPPMEIESLDPTLELDDPDETNEALKQISAADNTIEIEIPPMPNIPESSFEIQAPMEFSAEFVRTSESEEEHKDKEVAEVKSPEPPADTEEKPPSEEPTEPVEPPQSLPQMEASEKPIDIENTASTEMQMPDPLEIEEPLSNATGEMSSSELFDDNEDSMDFLKDSIDTNLEKADEIDTQETSASSSDPLREEPAVEVDIPAESRSIPQAIVAPYHPDPLPQYDSADRTSDN